MATASAAAFFAEKLRSESDAGGRSAIAKVDFQRNA